jgi:hypothetical protein
MKTEKAPQSVGIFYAMLTVYNPYSSRPGCGEDYLIENELINDNCYFMSEVKQVIINTP